MFKYSQDYELWSRASKFFDISNLPKPLILYRNHPGQVGRRFPEKQSNYVRLIHLEQLKTLSIEPTEEELNLHYLASRKIPRLGKSFSKKVNLWFKKLKKANQKNKIFPQKEFKKTLASYQERIQNTSLSFSSWAKGKIKMLFLNLYGELKRKVDI